jgi:membrane-associated phospholipid phosphatase
MNDVISITSADGLTFPFRLYRWGIALIQGIQTIQSPGLTGFIKGISALGTEYFYIPAILLIFWCADEKKGVRLGLLGIFSVFVNKFFKDLLKQPRPYSLEPSVGLAFEPTYGIPSGHAQLSLIFWLFLALSLWKKPAYRRGAVFMILIIAFSRLYLGVHFPTDILAGWLLGGLILGLWYILETPAQALLGTLGTRGQMIAAAVVTLVMNTLYPADRSLGGLFLGFGAGYALMIRHFSFIPGGDTGKPRPVVFTARFVLGISGAALIYLGFKAIFPGGGSLFAALPLWGAASPYSELGRFIRYGLLGLWVSAGAPWVFLRLGLATGPADSRVGD